MVGEPLAVEANTGQHTRMTRLDGVSDADRGGSARRVRDYVRSRYASVPSVCASVSLSDSGRLASGLSAVWPWVSGRMASGLSPYGVASFVHAGWGRGYQVPEDQSQPHLFLRCPNVQD